MSRSRRGFSLVEMLVVLVIVGILAMAVGNWYGAVQAPAVKGTVTSLAGFLAEARQVARTSGRTVTLTTDGHQATLTITFPTLGDDPSNGTPLLTTWLLAAQDRNATKYAGVDTDSNWPIYTQAGPNPDPLTGGVDPIKALFSNGATTLTATNKLFTGSTNTTISFDATGRPNVDFYVFVGGMRNSKSYSSAPVGLVLVTRANGIHAFYKAVSRDPAVPWQRL